METELLPGLFGQGNLTSEPFTGLYSPQESNVVLS